MGFNDPIIISHKNANLQLGLKKKHLFLLDKQLTNHSNISWQMRWKSVSQGEVKMAPEAFSCNGRWGLNRPMTNIWDISGISMEYGQETDFTKWSNMGWVLYIMISLNGIWLRIQWILVGFSMDTMNNLIPPNTKNTPYMSPKYLFYPLLNHGFLEWCLILRGRDY